LQQASKDGKRSKRKKCAAGENIKIGHGGTLDPLATGVLVVGVGKGTKQMSSFLGCTKTYETVVLFGKGTDTYDVAGKVVASAEHQHITKSLVEEKLAAFRGTIKQVPPIYSALKVNGMKAYDYARTGKELPRELEARDLEVEQCEIVEWLEGGKHKYRWPATEASGEFKQLAMELMASVQDGTQEPERPQKRRLSDLLDEAGEQQDDSKKKQRTAPEGITEQRSDRPSPHEGLPYGNISPDSSMTSSSLLPKELMAAEKAKLHTHEVGPLSSEICPAPAARIRVTASSGFYVRSFAHDLGIACGSLALMATLIRSRQGQFESSSTLTYQDLEGGEDIWGPKVRNMLQNWNDQHLDEPEIDDRGRVKGFKKESCRKGTGQRQRRDLGQSSRAKRNHDRERRNTSSGED
jgi:tRNA pseudouridine55 synthase